ncbi:MAG: hypothetical protein AAF127_11340 [Pseudomonadota bacterium]
MAAPTLAQQPNVDQPSSRSITDGFELGFKLCFAHIARRGHLAEEHNEMLLGMGVELAKDVPQKIRESSGPLFKEDRIFAKMRAAGGKMYILSAKNSTACRVVLADTIDGLRHRVAFVDRLRETSAWTYDKRRSGTRNGLMRDELTSASGRAVTIMNGPNYIFNQGNGVQAILTIALLPPQNRSSE